MEVVLGCDDFPADLAERYGYVNRALPPEELGPFVDALAYRIASFPANAIAKAKAAIMGGETPIVDGLLGESRCFNTTLGSPQAEQRMRAFMDVGGQTREFELELAENLSKVTEALEGK